MKKKDIENCSMNLTYTYKEKIIPVIEKPKSNVVFRTLDVVMFLAGLTVTGITTLLITAGVVFIPLLLW
mgnify:CR=1 FL=1